jgi:putative hydrolase of HD superfamily
MNDDDAQKISRFVHEVGQLKRVARSGWWAAGIKHPESVADHSLRTAVIAAFLARAEGADMEKLLLMAVFHDVPETRINDLHKVVQNYIDVDKAQRAAVVDQAASLPALFGDMFDSIHREIEAGATKEAVLLKDADLLECLFQAREYEALGYRVFEWVENTTKRLSSDTAKAIARAAMNLDPHRWWVGLKSQR